MTAQVSSAVPDPAALAAQVAELRRKNAWEESSRLASSLPAPLVDAAYLPAADEIAFALGQLKRTTEAIVLLEAGYTLEASARRASSLAYLYYSAALDRRKKDERERGRRRESGGSTTLDDLRRGFHRWMSEALRWNSSSIKDLYRLGIFEAQVEAQHDKQALRIFLKVVELYRALGGEERRRRHDLAPYYHRALYAGARSAMRLRLWQWARRLSFDCIREDEQTEHVAGVYKFALAGKVCIKTGELDAAERALRLALDAKGPRQRDFVYLGLAEVQARRSDLEGAIRWIEEHIPATHRSSVVWRRAGELHERAGRYDLAEPCFTHALRGDRMGRHKTLGGLARVRVAAADWKGAERALRDAIEFRRRQYNSEDAEMLMALSTVLERRGRSEQAAEVASRAADLKRRGGGRS